MLVLQSLGQFALLAPFCPFKERSHACGSQTQAVHNNIIMYYANPSPLHELLNNEVPAERDGVWSTLSIIIKHPVQPTKNLLILPTTEPESTTLFKYPDANLMWSFLFGRNYTRLPQSRSLPLTPGLAYNYQTHMSWACMAVLYKIF